MKFEIIAEWALTAHQHALITELLDGCFPDTFEGRTYFKQLPSLRVLACEEDALVGHLALDYRVIRVGAEVMRISGIVDLAVEPHARRQGIGSELLSRADDIAGQSGCDFAVAFADRHELYLSCGYQRLEVAETRFLAVEERLSHSLITRDLDDIFLVKPVGRADWPQGEIDLLGHIF